MNAQDTHVIKGMTLTNDGESGDAKAQKIKETTKLLAKEENGDTKTLDKAKSSTLESDYVRGNLLVSPKDHSTIKSIADEIGIDIEMLVAISLLFYYPLFHMVKDEGYMIQQGLNLRHLVPYTLSCEMPAPWEEAARFHVLSPEERISEDAKNGKGNDDIIQLTLSNDAWMQINATGMDVGQFVLDGIECYDHLRESWVNGDRIFLEKDDLVENEIDMEVFESAAFKTE